jgi:hypothetical protein
MDTVTLSRMATTGTNGDSTTEKIFGNVNKI